MNPILFVGKAFAENSSSTSLQCVAVVSLSSSYFLQKAFPTITNFIGFSPPQIFIMSLAWNKRIVSLKYLIHLRCGGRILSLSSIWPLGLEGEGDSSNQVNMKSYATTIKIIENAVSVSVCHTCLSLSPYLDMPLATMTSL